MKKAADKTTRILSIRYQNGKFQSKVISGLRWSRRIGKGEIASSLACESFQSFFSTFLEEEPSEEFINKAIRYTEARFDDYVNSHPEAKGMATTLTMVSVGISGITLAHIGDSRIYQFRRGEIIYQTEDHSLVNSLVKLGKISKEEAVTHPQKNVIIRAIQGTEHPTEADVALLNDIQVGDFFLCVPMVCWNALRMRIYHISFPLTVIRKT